MTPLATTATDIFSWGTLIAQAGIVISAIVLATLIFGKKEQTKLHHISKKTADHALLLGFIITLVALVSSLIYSNIIGFEPCELCWWQRVFLYPQVVLFAVALYNEKVNKIKDESVFLYSFVFSIIGGLVALFQYYGQMFNPSILAVCEAQGASCSKLFFVSFGYITIPMMSLTAYLVLLVLFFFRRHHR